jgi:glycosyltransferase involved in cell wall biosynthesis
VINVCLLGDFSANLDEGYKNTGFYLAQELETNCIVHRLNIKKIGSVDFWRELKRIKPDLVHTIAQPTLASFIMTYLLGKLKMRTPTVISALRPERYFDTALLTWYQRRLIFTSRPDLMLVQSAKAEAVFEALGCTVSRLANGVDLKKFQAVNATYKRELRIKHGLDPDRPVVLHVGHLAEERNLLALAELPHADIQVVVAGSLYMGTHHDLISQLEAAGYHLFKGYQPNIAELYMMADCYVFPPKPGNSLAMPLSVLEAMACNLPVITTRFSGLEETFTERHDFRFIAPDEAFLPQVQAVLACTTPVQTRQMVQAFSWSAIAQRLISYYQELLT